MKSILCALCLLLTACGSIPRISFGNASVQGVKDAGKPATLSSGETRSGVAIPANTPVKITKIDAVPATDKAAFQPAREEVTFVPTFDTKLESVSTSMQANTGTVDQTVALRKIDAAENRYLLFAAIGAALAGGFFLYIKYPTPAFICGATSVVFFLAWRLADLPSWFYLIGAMGLVAAVFLYLGHKRGENDGVKAAIAGNVEAPTPKVVVP